MTEGWRDCCCKHCIDATINSIGEQIVYCELTDEWMNVTLGECLCNCESEEEK